MLLNPNVHLQSILERKKAPVLLFCCLGGPGSGARTTSESLAARLGLPRFSIPELLREHVKRGEATDCETIRVMMADGGKYNSNKL